MLAGGEFSAFKAHQGRDVGGSTATARILAQRRVSRAEPPTSLWRAWWDRHDGQTALRAYPITTEHPDSASHPSSPSPMADEGDGELRRY